MKGFLYISLVFCLISCESKQESGVFFLSGYYDATADSAAVKVFYFDENAQQSNSFNRLVSVKGESGEVKLVQLDDFTFVSKGALPDWNEQVTIKVNGDHVMHCTVQIPVPIEAIFQSSSNVVIQSENPGEEVLTLGWTELSDDFSYLLQLESLSDMPSEIPFEGGLFEKQFSGPIEESAITLVASDFEYFGPHRLTVYVIPEAYKDVFFFQGRGLGYLATEGPDNVIGGKGFFTATRSISFEFEITQ